MFEVGVGSEEEDGKARCLRYGSDKLCYKQYAHGSKAVAWRRSEFWSGAAGQERPQQGRRLSDTLLVETLLG